MALQELAPSYEPRIRIGPIKIGRRFAGYVPVKELDPNLIWRVVARVAADPIAGGLYARGYLIDGDTLVIPELILGNPRYALPRQPLDLEDLRTGNYERVKGGEINTHRHFGSRIRWTPD